MRTQIKSLAINYEDEVIITDFDDTIVKTTASIRNNGLDPYDFFMNGNTYNEFKDRIFSNIELTDFGNELIRLISTGVINKKKVFVVTHAIGRLKYISNLLGIDEINIHEGKDPEAKARIIYKEKRPLIFIDDKRSIINDIKDRDKLIKICYKYALKRKFRTRRR